MFQLVYELLDWFLQIVVDIFFREVSIRGSFNFPSSGPTIVVIAPHANQYLDAAISVLSAKVVSNRQVFMIEAASSYRNSWMSLWSKWSGAIPVERPQDLLAPKDGIIRFANYPTDQLTIVGENTHFLRDCGPKGLIGLPNKAGNVKIAQIVSDTKLVLASKMKKQAGIELLLKGTTYMFAPRIDNSQLFEKVFDALKEGTCIGIAPEGGSHDRPELLEFKPGVALMALGAVAKYSDINVTIVPCGLNYFHPHKFRSRAVVEYGTPIVVGQERVQSYKNDSRKAVSDLMAEITAAMNLVTTQAPDYETLQVIQAVRRLYSYGRFHRPPLPVVVEMNRNLLIGYKEFKDDPKVIHLRDSVLDYNHKLRTFGLKDHQLEDASLNKLQTFQLLIKRVCLLLFYGVLSLPGTILFSPIFITCSVMSKKKQKIALSKSVVKINATDVLASWKVLIALFFAPVCYFIYSVTSVLLIIHYELLPDTTRSFSGKILIFCVSWAVLVCTTYSAFKMGEVGMDIYKSILPLVLFLSPFSQQLVKLKEERKNLSIEVTELINELGPKVFKKFNETFIDDLKEQVEQEEEEIRSNSRSRSTSRSRSASRSRSSSKLRLIQNSGSLHNPTPSLSRTSSNYSGFSNFDGSDDHGKLPDFSHVSIFSDQLQMPDSETSATSSFENISSFNEALSTGVETSSLTEKIKKAVIQRNLESESQEK